MAYNALNNLIDAYIYANGVQAITGQILNGVLKQMVSQLGSGYHLMGVAGPETVPASNDYAMAYFAATAGEYTDFGGITLAPGEVAVLLTYGNGSWEKQTIYNVPTGTADLENTANFITNAVTDLVNYYTKTEVDDTLAGYPTLEALATALADYYTKQEVDTTLDDYATKDGVDETLEDYYTKDETDAELTDRYTKQETDTKLGDYYKKTETYDKDEVDSIVAALSRQEYIVAWDGLAAPDVSAIPAGVTVTYNATPYTGTLAASASTVNKIYMVWNGVAYDMYGTSQDGGYSWVPMGTTSVDLSQYATKAELSQLQQEVTDLPSIPQEKKPYFTTGKYIITAVSVGQTVDVNNPVVLSGWAYIVLAVKKGDKYRVIGTGGSNPRLWCFTDTSYKKLSSADAGTTAASYLSLTAPQDGYLIVNVNSNNQYSLLFDLFPTINAGIEKNATDIASLQSATSVIPSYGNRIAELETQVGTNQFAVTRAGNIDASGHYYVSTLGICTYLIPVSEGDKWHYNGGWMDNNAVGLVWGYTSNAYANPTMLQVAKSLVDTVITIPSGITYIMAWSATGKPSVLQSLDSLRPRVEILEENSIGEKSVLSNNLFNSATVIKNHYVRFDNGRVDALADFDASDYIKVEPETVYSQRYSQQMAFYDEEKTYISGITGLTDGKFTTPAGAAYVRITVAGSLTATQQINKGNSLLPYDNYAEGYKKLFVPTTNIISPKVTRITATRNVADYNSIRELMASINDATADNQYEIFIPKGEWFECDIVGKKYVSLVGEDEDETILYCDGASNNLTPADYSWGNDYSGVALSSLNKDYKHCFRPTADISVKNMTIRVNDCKYAAHIDTRGYNEVYFENCHFIANGNTNYPVGTGLTSGQKLTLQNCVFVCNAWQPCGVFVHNGGNGQQTSPCYLTINECYFNKCGFLLITELGSNQNDVFKLTNCYSDRGGAITWFVDVRNSSTTYWINEDDEYEENPQNVPYNIHLNALGSNVGGLKLQKWNVVGDYYGLTTRPDAYKVSKLNNIKPVPKSTYNVGDIVHGTDTGFAYTNPWYAPAVGVVVAIDDTYAYVQTSGTVFIPCSSVTGATPTDNAKIYAKSNHLSTDETGDAIAIVSSTYTTGGVAMCGITLY